MLNNERFLEEKTIYLWKKKVFTLSITGGIGWKN